MTEAHLQLFVDLGSSLTKIFYYDPRLPERKEGKQKDDERDQYLLMSPATATVSKQRVADVLALDATAPSVDTAWVELGVGEKEAHRDLLNSGSPVVCAGRLAENFKGDAALPQRKIEAGLSRTLAAIGVVREQLQLPPSFSCSLGVALPITEHPDRKALEQLLQDNSTFICRGQLLKVEYRQIFSQPEGLGLIRERRFELSRQGNCSPKIVGLMFGHRNLSLLVFEGGSLRMEGCRSDGPGFVEAVEIAAKRLGLEPRTEGLMEAVAGKKSVLRVQGQLEPLKIEAAVEEGRAGYWQRVESFLKSYLPGGEYELVYGGGSAWAMQGELKALFEKSEIRPASLDRLQRRLGEVLKLPKGFAGEANALGSLRILQLLDSYGGFRTLVLKDKQVAV